MGKIKIGIVGGTGYTGVELLRLLVQHPDVEIHAITSRQEAGRPVAEVFPNLRGWLDIPFLDPADERLTQCDLVFFATPNGVAMKDAPTLLDNGVRVVDLAADFRLRDVPDWERWYGMRHSSPDWVSRAVTGCQKSIGRLSKMHNWLLIRDAIPPLPSSDLYPCWKRVLSTQAL